MKKNFKKNFWVNLGISLGAILIILAANYSFSFDIGARVREIQKLKKEKAFRTQAIDSLVVLKDGARRAAQYYNTLFNLLPTRDNLINFRKKLISLAASRNIELGFIFVGDSPAKDDKPGFADFEATASGKRKDFLPFLKSIEKGSYFIKLNSIDFNSIGEEFNSSLRGRVFSR